MIACPEDVTSRSYRPHTREAKRLGEAATAALFNQLGDFEAQLSYEGCKIVHYGRDCAACCSLTR